MTLIDIIDQVKSETEKANSSFSSVLPRLQLGIDATSLDALKKCARYYKYAIIDGYVLPFQNDHLTFGLIFHSATELYAHLRSDNIDHEKALISVIRYVIVETWDFELKRPWTSEIPEKSRNTLLRTVVWYLDHFKDDNLKTLILENGKPAVELSFRFNSNIETQTTGEHFQLCGHIDRVVEWNGQTWITDKKTTKYALDDGYFRQYTPDTQISLYTIAGIVVLNQEVDGLIVDAAQVLVTGGRFRRQPIPRSPEQLEEWMKDLGYWLRQLEAYAIDGYYPMNEHSCGYGNNQCVFRSVCSADPSIREDLLYNNFNKRQWDPLQPR